MDTRFVDRELAAWERLHKLAEARGIELPPELAIELGEDSLVWTEARCVAYLERELARRLAGLATVVTPRTELPLPPRPLPVQAAPDYAVRQARWDAAEGRPVVSGRPGTLKVARQLDHEQRKAAAAARRRAR